MQSRVNHNNIVSIHAESFSSNINNKNNELILNSSIK